jgi:hypothetical protein
LLWRKRRLIRGPGVGEWAWLSISIHKGLLLRLEIRNLGLLLWKSSLLWLEPVYKLSLSWLRKDSGLLLQLWLAILLLEPLLIKIIEALAWRSLQSGGLRDSC